MLRNAARVPFKFHFGAPSCVPATAFETAGAVLGPEEVDMLLQDEQIYYLSEMMNYPGVLQHQPDADHSAAILELEQQNPAHRLGDGPTVLP